MNLVVIYKVTEKKDMSSYCDINKLAADSTNHPFFTQRMNNWKNGPNGANGCIPYSGSVSGLNANSCLTDSEIACYSNYTLETARKQLDNSLSEIYNSNSSKSATFDSNYQATMLTGVIWAALGTTVLYYAFTKI